MHSRALALETYSAKKPLDGTVPGSGEVLEKAVEVDIFAHCIHEFCIRCFLVAFTLEVKYFAGS